MIVKVEIIASKQETQDAYKYLDFNGFKPNYIESGPIPEDEECYPHYRVVGTKNVLTGHRKQVMDFGK